jgi:DnaJ-class molecular chaperone
VKRYSKNSLAKDRDQKARGQHRVMKRNQRKAARRQASVQYKKGDVVEVKYPVVCPTCTGRGTLPGPVAFTRSQCPECRGDGEVNPVNNFLVAQ